MAKKPEIIGYEGFGINHGKFVAADDALDYALKECGVAIVDSEAPECEEACKAIEEWFFSDNWVEKREEVEEDDGDF